MPLVACGINHKTAPLSVREQVFFLPENMPAPLIELVDQVPVREAAILSTCNRTDLYCEADHAKEIVGWLKQRHQHCHFELDPYLYLYQEEEAVRHILRVASGLDSMIIGEPQILGQLKSAVSTAHAAGTLGTELQRLFQYVFSVTKQIRSSTPVGVNAITVVSAALQLAKQIFTDLSKTSVLLIGAGETIELAAKHIAQHRVKRCFIANRTVAKASALAEKAGAQVISMSEIPHFLAQVDIIISATASQLPILGKGAIESAIKARKRRPMFIGDLAVPRDVEEQVNALPDVYLYTLDDLQRVIQENIDKRLGAAEEAQAMIDQHTTHYMKYLRSLDAVDTIRAYRKKVIAIRDQELNKAITLLHQGVAPIVVLEAMATALSNKLMHSPSVQMKQAAYAGQDEFLAFARQLLDVKDEIS